MKKSLSISCLVILIITATFFSCDNKRETAANKIEFDTINIARFHHLENDSTKPSCNIKINFIYPVKYENDEILGKVNDIFIAGLFDEDYLGMEPKDAMEKYITEYIKDYEEDAKYFSFERKEEEADFRGKYYSYYESLSNEIKFNKANLLSMQVMQSNKKGDNNSFRRYLNLVVDLSTGKTLTEEDIFDEDYEKVLNLIFKEKLFTSNNVKNVHDLEDLGYFGIEEIAPNNNFLIGEDGVTYIFNKGEYSVLQTDEITIQIPYNELSRILKEKSPISNLYSI